MEFKKTDPFDYKASPGNVEILDLQPRLFASIEGAGDPNGDAFAGAVEALYIYSYAVRMSGKDAHPPAGWFPYVVGVLQGRWTLQDGCAGFDPSKKSDLAWTIMIRQPSFLDKHLHEQLLEKATKKARTKGGNALPWLEKLQLDNREGGRFAQILHEGPYDNEPTTFARMERLLADQVEYATATTIGSSTSPTRADRPPSGCGPSCAFPSPPEYRRSGCSSRSLASFQPLRT